MPKYRQLTEAERYQIQALSQAGVKQVAIARQIGRSQSSISREFTRNKEGESYSAEVAQKRCDCRHANKPKMRKDWDLWGPWVHQCLKLNFTPERIALESKRQKPFGGQTISHEWIYLRLRDDALKGGCLWRYLPRAKRKRVIRLPQAGKRGNICNRVSIAERPPVVDERSRLGDWEVDTVISVGKKSALVTAVERKSRLYLTCFVPNRCAQTVADALIKMLRPYAKLGQVHTITSDNGTEFAQHEAVAQALNCRFYFAEPYSSYQRGSNEHHNGLLRRFFPKGTDFAKISSQQLNAAVTMINLWPRKNLNGLRPVDIMELHLLH